MYFFINAWHVATEVINEQLYKLNGNIWMCDYTYKMLDSKPNC